MLHVLEREGEIAVDEHVREKLCSISAATVDRLLASDKRHLQIRGRTHTAPGSMLKHQIPIRTFGEWDEREPGYLEIDLVAHEGGNSRGEFAFTLTATDIYSAWTEVRVLQNKAQKWVFQALLDIRASLPFDLLGIDSDNGSEFINNQLMRYGAQQGIQFTRVRPAKKNDNCYVAQKNNAVVRRAVGYQRFDTDTARAAVATLYEALNPSVNYFHPVRKLQSKTREGSKQKRIYDAPATPCQRLLRCDSIPQSTKENLRCTYESLNPAQLKRKILRTQQRLWTLASPPAMQASA